MKKCIYFALMGDYDTLKEPTIITPGWDYICFTNNSKLKSKTWDIRLVDDSDGLDNQRLSRKFLILNHRHVGEYDISITTGAQMRTTCDLDVFLKTFLPDDDKIDMSMPRHPCRKCIYAEAGKCKSSKKDSPKIIDKQMDFYRKEGLPENNGLIATGIMIRKHNRSNLEEHCEKWWSQVKRWSFRDQLSFNYVLWKYSLININYFSYDIVRNKGNFFKKYPHKGRKK